MIASLKKAETPRPTDVLGLPILPLKAAELIDLLADRARSGTRTTVFYANAHTVNLACKDPAYRAVLGGCDVLYADGASVVWASRLGARPLPQRLTAADTFPRFARRCAEQGLSLFLLGGRGQTAEAAAAHLIHASPDLRIAGTHHGYFRPDDSNRVVGEINAARPDVLIVGMASPAQERWLAAHASDLCVPVRWCVGALFDYLAEREPRAPRWLCCVGAEWVFRLWVDPVGKWRRYLLGNPLFVWNALCWWLHRSTRRGPQHPADTRNT